MVVGDISGSANVINVLSLTNGQVRDTFWAHQVSVSPDARFVAFVEFYPRTTPVPTSVYLLYDVTQPPGANRMTGGGIDVNQVWAIGWALYPDESRIALSYNLTLYGEDHEHALSSPLTWVTNTDLVFVDYYEAAGTSRLVRVNTSTGLSTTRVQTIDLDEAALVDVMNITPGVDPAAILSAESISLTNTDTGVEVRVQCSRRSQPGVKVESMSYRFTSVP